MTRLATKLLGRVTPALAFLREHGFAEPKVVESEWSVAIRCVRDLVGVETSFDRHLGVGTVDLLRTPDAQGPTVVARRKTALVSVPLDEALDLRAKRGHPYRPRYDLREFAPQDLAARIASQQVAIETYLPDFLGGSVAIFLEVQRARTAQAKAMAALGAAAPMSELAAEMLDRFTPALAFLGDHGFSGPEVVEDTWSTAVRYMRDSVGFKVAFDERDRIEEQLLLQLPEATRDWDPTGSFRAYVSDALDLRAKRERPIPTPRQRRELRKATPRPFAERMAEQRTEMESYLRDFLDGSTAIFEELAEDRKSRNEAAAARKALRTALSDLLERTQHLLLRRDVRAFRTMVQANEMAAALDLLVRSLAAAGSELDELATRSITSLAKELHVDFDEAQLHA